MVGPPDQDMRAAGAMKGYENNGGDGDFWASRSFLRRHRFRRFETSDRLKVKD